MTDATAGSGPRDLARWQAANARYLQARLALVQRRLRQADTEAAEAALGQAARDLPAPSALERLCDLFGLSSFERDVVLLAAGVELDPAFALDCGQALGQGRAAPATFALAMAVLPEADWNALTPAAPLRFWRLIDVAADNLLSRAELRIDERILHFLHGITYLDARLALSVEPVPPPEILPTSQQALARDAAACLAAADDIDSSPVLQLCGPADAAKRGVAAAACGLVGLQLHALKASRLPASSAERSVMARLWQRESLLSRSALLVELDEPGGDAAVESFVDGIPGILFVAADDPIATERATIRIDVRKPTATEQRTFWRAALGEHAGRLNGHLERLTAQFDLEPSEIHAASMQALAGAPADDPDALARSLWSACRSQARRQVRDLAHHVEPRAGWSDLVLPDAQLQMLRDMVAQVRHRTKVYEEWGFAAKSARGLGIGALFAGQSGTGKTLAAEVIARELALDLHQIDLSQIVSKYIGETEKNLRRVFDAAQDAAAVLLFDEADALFGKRGEVKDSHDRYANIEVSYLLQRVEAYRGLAILTTNMRSQIDAAFVRRLRFIVQFPFPDAAQRTDIWRHVFPTALPTDSLVPERLAQLNVSGGSIRNIALTASFFAASDGEPVRMAHLLRAAHMECGKLEKAVSPQEVRGWL